MDVYSSFDWSTLCAEVAKLKIELPEGKLLVLPVAAIARAASPRNPDEWTKARGPAVVQSPKLRVLPQEKERPRRDSNPCYLRERRVS